MKKNTRIAPLIIALIYVIYPKLFKMLVVCSVPMMQVSFG